MSNYHTKIQEVIQWQNIRQLVHFTRIANLRSIIEYGILSRQEIEKRKIKVEFNDPQRLDAWPNTSSVSITEKNIYLFPKFVERSKTNEKDWFDILINPSILTEKECIFCDTNASNHKFNGVLDNFGKSDITYNLSFKLIEKILKKFNLKINGMTNQKSFLLNLGILKRAEIISKNLPFSKKADIYFRIKRLIDKNSMGELFKVILATNKNVNFQTGFIN